MASPFALASAAYDAGIRSPVPLGQATAVAMAATGGNERARQGDRYGPWLTPGTEALYDLPTAAKAMAAASAGGTNWATFPAHGGAAYWLMLPGSQAAAAAVIAGKGGQRAAETVVEPIGDVVDAARAGVGFATRTAAWFADRNNWVRIAKVVAGISLVTVGIAAAVRPQFVQQLGTLAKSKIL